MWIKLADGTSISAEDLRDSTIAQWQEQTPKDDQTFESFCSFMRLAGFDWDHQWMVDQWEYMTGP